MDRESLRREKARQSYERLRSRPRSKHDTPSLEAIFAPGHEPLAQGIDRFHSLISRFVGASDFVEDWIIVRTPEDQAAETGLHILRHKEEHLDFLRKRGADDDGYMISVEAFSTRINPGDRFTMTAICSYSGGLAEQRHNKLSFNCNIPPEDHNLTLQEYLAMIRSIVEWREPRLIVVGPGTYKTYDRVFWNRAWKGWIGWFPQEIDPRALPDFALTWRIGKGTAVATQETNVLSRFPDQKEKANELEVALVDAGVLPTSDELKGFK